MLGKDRDPFKEAREDRRKEVHCDEALARLFWPDPGRYSKKGELGRDLYGPGDG